MINTSNEYKSMIRRNRTFIPKATITLTDSTVLNLTKDDIMQGGLRIDDSVGEKISIGTAIINKSTLTLNNFSGKFSDYDFNNAVIRPYSGLQLSETIEYLAKGVFTIDNPNAKGPIIILDALDNMAKFNAEFANVTISFPCTSLQLLQAVCLHCGVSLSTVRFINDNYIINDKPTDESISCREIVAWVAQLAGCFARCNVQGALELKWYDFEAFEDEDNLNGGVFDSSTPYSSGDNADGGNFTNYSSGDNIDGGTFTNMDRYHHLYSFNGNPTIGTDDIIITGIQVTDSVENPTTVLFGTSGYILPIAENPLIQNSTQATLIANAVGSKIVGMKFRLFSGNTQSDPSMEAGDVAYVSDRKRNNYPILITTLNYTIGNIQAVSCGAETPNKNKSYRPTSEMKAIIEARKQAQRQLTAYDLAVQQLNGIMANAMGFYEHTEEQPDGSKIEWMHDKPTLAESKIIWKKSIDGFAVSTDGGVTYTSGFTADGNIIAKTLSVIGINAEWIKVLTSFSVGNDFSVDNLGRLIAKSGKIGPFQMDNTGLFSNSMSFYDNNNDPWIWITKKGDNGQSFPSEGSSRSNYEPDVWDIRNVKNGVLTDMYGIARDGENGKIGYIGIDKSDANNGESISEVRLSDTGLAVENYTNGDVSKTYSLTEYGAFWSDYNTGQSFNIFVDNSSGNTYIQASNKVYINGRNIDDVELALNTRISDLEIQLSWTTSKVYELLIKFGML